VTLLTLSASLLLQPEGSTPLLWNPDSVQSSSNSQNMNNNFVIIQQSRVVVSNRFAGLDDLDTEVEINSDWETIRDNINISVKESLGYFELKKHKPWFDEGCSKLLDQRKQVKLQWLQDPSKINGDNVNNVRREASRHFRSKKKGISERQY
jgi:hypothetical protein